jgi:hypothetical protein
MSPQRRRDRTRSLLAPSGELKPPVSRIRLQMTMTEFTNPTADAAIGAAVSGLALALVAGLALLIAWRSRRAEPPERNELASA